MMDHPLSSSLYLYYDQVSARLFEERQQAVRSLKTAADAENYIAETKMTILI